MTLSNICLLDPSKVIVNKGTCLPGEGHGRYRWPAMKAEGSVPWEHLVGDRSPCHPQVLSQLDAFLPFTQSFLQAAFAPIPPTPELVPAAHPSPER